MRKLFQNGGFCFATITEFPFLSLFGAGRLGQLTVPYVRMLRVIGVYVGLRVGKSDQIFAVAVRYGIRNGAVVNAVLKDRVEQFILIRFAL